MGVLSNTDRSERVLKSKLNILRRTIRMRGTDCIRIRSTNKNYSKVHGVNNIDISGDNRRNTEQVKIRLILNLNTMDRVTEKGMMTQTTNHCDDVLEEGDLIKVETPIYTYHFRVERKSFYGINNFIYEYELDHLKTVRR